MFEKNRWKCFDDRKNQFSFVRNRNGRRKRKRVTWLCVFEEEILNEF